MANHKRKRVLSTARSLVHTIGPAAIHQEVTESFLRINKVSTQEPMALIGIEM
jgi:hypothetical protein